jgi:hypothetical protein
LAKVSDLNATPQQNLEFQTQIESAPHPEDTNTGGGGILDPLRESSDELVARILSGNFGGKKLTVNKALNSNLVETNGVENGSSTLPMSILGNTGLNPTSANLKDMYLSSADAGVHTNASERLSAIGADFLSKTKILNERKQLYEKYS